MSSPDRKSILILLTVFLVVVSGTLLISFFARGYQVNFKNGPSLQATGLLSATSKPKGAGVYLNDKLITATDDTLNLPPGEYLIKIIRDGFLPWSKKIQIKKEIVYQTDAQLFRSVPDLRPVTLTGAINPAGNLDSNKIVFAVASASASKDNGLYIVDTFDNPLTFNRAVPHQIATNYPGVDWSKFTFTFSPDNKQLLASSKTASYLLPLDAIITQNDLNDATPRLGLIKQTWSQQTRSLLSALIPKVPPELVPFIATDAATHLQLSSDDSKVLYLATISGQLKKDLITPPPAQSTQIQSRNIQKDNYYIYDLKDDTNFLIGPASTINHPFWLPNSYNLVYTQDQVVKTIEFDSTNLQTLFAGNFDPKIVYPWADGTRLITLTSAYPGAPANLFTISIR